MPRFRILGAAFSMALIIGGCRLDNALPRTSCVTTADCTGSSTCQNGTCLDGVAAACQRFPSGLCSQPEGSVHAINSASELLSVLPGRWQWCTGDPVSGMPFKLGPSDTIGLEFSADSSQWWFLVDDGSGNAVHRTGFESGGSVDVLGMPGFVQLNLVETTDGVLITNPAFTDGPPMHMLLRSHGPAAYYVHDDDACASTAGDMAVGDNADMGAAGSFGGMCNPNIVTASSCPAVGDVSCSVCAGWQCVQPCHVANNDCSAPQTCIALDSYTLSGACVGYDGYCK